MPAVSLPESEQKCWRLYLEEMKAGRAYVRSDFFVSGPLLGQMLASLAVGATSALLIVPADLPACSSIAASRICLKLAGRSSGLTEPKVLGT